MTGWARRRARIAAEQVAACLHWVEDVPTLNEDERQQWLDAAHEWALSFRTFDKMVTP